MGVGSHGLLCPKKKLKVVRSQESGARIKGHRLGFENAFIRVSEFRLPDSRKTEVLQMVPIKKPGRPPGWHTSSSDDPV
jgi:hypothetical protein